MKKLFVSFALIACASAAQARTAADVCRLVATYSSSNGAACLGVINQGQIQDTAADICYQVSTSSPSNGVECLRNSLNKTIDYNAASVCTFIATYSSSNGTACINAIANKTYTADETSICRQVAASSPSNGVNCLLNAGRAVWAPRCPSIREIQEYARAAQNNLRTNRIYETDRILSDLQYSLSNCR